MSEKRRLNATETKQEFIGSIHNWLMHTLERLDRSEYKKCFTIDGSSIMCELPPEYFTNFEIPEGTRIEMKFVTKRN